MMAPGRSAAELRPLASIGQLPVIEPLDSIELGPGDVDIWCCFYDDVRDPELLAAYEALMAPDERVRHRRLIFARHRLQFLVTRALCRWALSRYAPVAPGAWCFASGAHGKPAITAPVVRPQIWFNLSNTQGLVACAVSAAHEFLGVDVEAVDRKTDLHGLAERFFAAREADALHALAAEQRRERFFSYWTLKESYIKACGLGLRIPLGQFAFDLEDGMPIGVSFDPRLKDDPSHWRFALLRASAEHLLAVGAKVGPGAPMRLRMATCIPFRGLAQSVGAAP